MSECPSPDRLSSFAHSPATSPDAAALEAHCKTCESCSLHLRELRSDVTSLGGAESRKGLFSPRFDNPTLQRSFSSPQSGKPPSDSIVGYELLQEVHRGGQGVVYQAIQRTTKRRVAVKVLREGPFAGPQEIARFQREVQILATLKHANVVAIHDSGVASGTFYYVMDYISGMPLDEYAKEKELSVTDTLTLFVQVCDGISAAHLRGIIHRDLKPANIRVDSAGVPQILDFGLARTALGNITDDATPELMTMTGQFVGSPPWASPEQAEGVPDKIDFRTDVYSLGVILYQLLTGQFPYEIKGTVMEVLEHIREDKPIRPRSLRRDVDDEVETIVLKCLAKDRERRNQSAGELARDIRHYLAGEPIEAKRDSTFYVLRKVLRRYRLPVAAASALLAVIVVTWIGAPMETASSPRA